MMLNYQPKWTYFSKDFNITKQTYEKFGISSVSNIFKFRFKFKLVFKFGIKSSIFMGLFVNRDQY